MIERGFGMLRALAFGGAIALAGCAAPSGGKASAEAARAPAEVEAAPDDNGYGAYLAAHAARLRDDIGGAADNLQRTLANDPGNLDVLRLALVYSAADGRMEDAAATAREVVQQRPGDLLAGYVLAEQAAKAGDWAAADAALKPIPGTNLNALLGPLLKAWVAAGSGNVDEAIARLKPLTDNPAFRPVYNFHSAMIYDLGGRISAASDAYTQTLAGEGGNSIHALQAAGRFFNRIGQPDRTRALMADYLDKHDGSPLADALSERLVIRRDASPLLTSAADGMGEAFFSVASSLTNAEAWEVTLALSQLALDANPRLDLARVLLGDLYEAHDAFAHANAAYAAISPDADVAYSVRLRMAKNLERMDKNDEAADQLKDLAAKHPDRPEPLIELGDLYRSTSRFEEAVVAYDGAIARIEPIEPRHWVLFYTRGIALERSKQWARAEADFVKALELEPDQPLVMNYLGYSWLDQGKNMDAAQQMIEKAVAQRPRDGYIVDSLGWAYYLRGKYEDAVTQLEQAAVLVADDPTINDHLGDAYWRVGRTLEARYQWQRALGLKPEDAQEKLLRDKLEHGLPPVAKP